MARPRVFVSSTFIDFRQVRADIESFLREIGFEAILFERGSVPYAHESSLDISAYSEVERSDILVAVIGSRLGTTSSLDSSSITQTEIKRAVELDKPIFIFVDRDTLAEYRTWDRNKHISGLKFVHAEDPKIFEFLSSIYAMKRNNPIFPFQFASEIVFILREQFAGLFQDMLARRTASTATDLIGSLRDLASNLDNIVSAIAKNSIDKDFIVEQILLVNHPLFQSLRKHTGTEYRLYFTNIEELRVWLGARGWKEADDFDLEAVKKFRRAAKDFHYILKISDSLFDASGALRPLRQDDWKDDFVTSSRERNSSSKPNIDDDIPF